MVSAGALIAVAVFHDIATMGVISDIANKCFFTTSSYYSL